MLRIRPIASITCPLVLANSVLFASPAATRAAEPVFTGIQSADRLVDDSPVQRARRIDLVQRDFVLGDTMNLNFFDDASFTAQIEREQSPDGHGTVWTGNLYEGGVDGLSRGWFIYSQYEDAVTINAWTDDNRAFEVRSDANGVLWSRELEENGFEPCATGAAEGVDDHAHHAHSHPSQIARGGCPDAGDIIDVMIVYTPAARNNAGGTNSIRSLANSAAAAANTSYANSEIDLLLRVVYLDEIAFSETSSISSDLGSLRGTSDGVMDEVHAIRDDVAADMVAMISNNTGACGVASLMTNLSGSFQSRAFSVTRYSCAVGNLTFAHELGHNMGCTHDRGNAGSSLFSYSFGHRWISTNGRQYRSVMSYSPGSRIAQFSNPDVSFIGTPTGIPSDQPNSADNARTIRESKFTIANFRNSGIYFPASFSQNPADASVDPGESVEFSAAVNSTEPASLIWTKDQLPVEPDPRISGIETDTLTITDVRPADAGVYKLFAINSCGSSETLGATLTVTSPCVADLAAPFGTLNFFDLGAFLDLFNAADPAADLADPTGVFNFFDLGAFLEAFNAGCP